MPNIIEIHDFNAPELDIYARLTENQLLNRHEPEKGLFIAESPKVIERALNAGCVPVSLLIEKSILIDMQKISFSDVVIFLSTLRNLIF